MSRLREQYTQSVTPALREQFRYDNVMQTPRVTKVVINIGVGDAKDDANFLESAVSELSQISGQRPKITRARKSIASFKVRENMPVGCVATLRGQRMWEFLDRLFNVALPRIRDFQGLPRSAFDGRGNYNIGLQEQIIFPEIDYDKIARVRGMNITICTTANTDEEAAALLSGLGMPLRAA